MPNPVVHFEIVGKDGGKLRSYYGDLFGWAFQVAEELDYGMVEASEGGIGGGVGAGGPDGSFAGFYVQVDDPQKYLDRAIDLGGEVVQPVTEIPNVVTFAKFKDPEGNVVGIVKG